MATVIFSNMGDTDSAVLKYIWLGLPNVKVVEVGRNTKGGYEMATEAIEQEHDTLIMCGHGMPQGLLNPNMKETTYLVDRHNKDKIRCNRVIGIWCHAKSFAMQQGLRGFWSSMFISNRMEAMMNNIHNVSSKSITEQEILFGIRLNELIRNYIPMKDWVKNLRNEADYTNAVVKFNYDGLRYFKTEPKPEDLTANLWYKKAMDFEKKRWNIDVEPAGNKITNALVKV